MRFKFLALGTAMAYRQLSPGAYVCNGMLLTCAPRSTTPVVAVNVCVPLHEAAGYIHHANQPQSNLLHHHHCNALCSRSVHVISSGPAYLTLQHFTMGLTPAARTLLTLIKPSSETNKYEMIRICVIVLSMHVQMVQRTHAHIVADSPCSPSSISSAPGTWRH